MAVSNFKLRIALFYRVTQPHVTCILSLTVTVTMSGISSFLLMVNIQLFMEIQITKSSDGLMTEFCIIYYKTCIYNSLLCF